MSNQSTTRIGTINWYVSTTKSGLIAPNDSQELLYFKRSDVVVGTPVKGAMVQFEVQGAPRVLPGEERKLAVNITVLSDLVRRVASG